MIQCAVDGQSHCWPPERPASDPNQPTTSTIGRRRRLVRPKVTLASRRRRRKDSSPTLSHLHNQRRRNHRCRLHHTIETATHRFLRATTGAIRMVIRPRLRGRPLMAARRSQTATTAVRRSHHARTGAISTVIRPRLHGLPLTTARRSHTATTAVRRSRPTAPNRRRLRRDRSPLSIHRHGQTPSRRPSRRHCLCPATNFRTSA